MKFKQLKNRKLKLMKQKNEIIIEKNMVFLIKILIL